LILHNFEQRLSSLAEQYQYTLKHKGLESFSHLYL
jgi:hypothetical protein